MTRTESFAHLLADELDQRVEVELGRERLADAVHRPQLGHALPRFMYEAGVVERDAEATGQRHQEPLVALVEDYADEVLGPLLRSILEARSSSGAHLQPAERRELERHLETQYRNLEQLFSQRNFVFGGAPGLADIALYAFLSRLVQDGQREISAGFPHLKAWYGRMETL